MDVLKAEIARKRKSLEQLCAVEKKCRYFKRSALYELERKRFDKRTSNDDNDKAATLMEDKRGEMGVQVGSSDLFKDESLSAPVLDAPFSIEDVKRRLRVRQEPIRMFGEEDRDVFERLCEIEVSEHRWKGQRNDFKEAMDHIEKTYQETMLDKNNDAVSNNPSSNAIVEIVTHKQVVISGPDPGMTYEELALIIKDRKRSDLQDSTIILSCFKIILKRWADHLNELPTDQCRSISGRIETALFQQTLSYLGPLFRKLKANSLATDILDSLIDVVQSIFSRNYRKANEYFLELAIGNAPWPIGATNVGIHPRPGREKIASKHVAHVLNDETQRKYLQAVKRIITKAQLFYPGEAALSVEYHVDHDE